MKFFPNQSATEFLHVVSIQSFYYLIIKKGLRALSYIGPSFKSNLEKFLKTSVSLNTFNRRNLMRHSLSDARFVRNSTMTYFH